MDNIAQKGLQYDVNRFTLIPSDKYESKKTYYKLLIFIIIDVSGEVNLIIRATYYICENYPSMITEASLAAQLNLSVQHMHRLFLSETGMSPIQYLNAYRIHCAKKMLEEDDLPIYAIAASSGFATPNYFCTVFRKYSGGLSPLEYRRAHHNTLVQKKRLSK